MATLSIAQMYALARTAGLSPPRAIIAAAVGQAESSGETGVTSANPDGGTNVGIWQLDTRGKGSGYTVAQLQNPSTNAAVMAKGTSNGTDWSAWQTYTQGTYSHYLTQAEAAAAAESGHPGGSGSWLTGILHGIEGVPGDIAKTVSGVTGIVGQVLGLPSQVTDFLTALEGPVKALMWLVNPANWVRLLAGFFGVVLAGFGLYALAKAA